MSHRPNTDNFQPAEPVAVIGIGCRFPGDVGSPEDFWRLLAAGGDTYGEIPDERWARYRRSTPEFATALRHTVTRGSFLSDIGRFDAEFFGISPREAALMDPQQRLLLEVTWEALEQAGLPPRDLAGSDAGVFVGVCTGDYGALMLEDLASIEAWTGIGAATCAVANRISHSFDLRGPSMTVDTACSASLVALHLATQSLRNGECEVAIVGGVNLVVTPGQTLTLDAAGALAPDGRSKAFDAAADGYGRGEGCGVVVLRRLADAQRDGEQVLAVVRGSSVNQDGRTNGIMAPSGEAQAHVMERACAHAGIDPASVDFVEAHGTGTRLGDPMEAQALAAVYGSGRPAGEPCLIGSVKSNIGHLEGAAGVASVIKTVLALHRAEIPRSPLVTELNPEIPWDRGEIRLVTEHTPWPARSGPRRAGVSGFGYGGTVAHVVLEQAPESADVPAAEPDGEIDRLFPISAASDAALRAYADRLADWLTDSAGHVPLASVGHTLAMRRSRLARNAAIVAGDEHELVARLRELAADRPDPGVATGVAATPGNGLVWVFSGHGSQWRGMGRDLLAVPEFAAVVDAIEPIFAEEIGFSPRQVLIDDEVEGVDRIQTMIFVMQVGLAELWRSHGVTPAAIIGHSVGEIAAAVASGALSLTDGARLICRRSSLLRRVAGQGAMVMATMPLDEAAERLSGRTDLVAAIASSPLQCVISGDPEAIEEVLERWPAEGIGVRRVASDVAFHSPHMDPLLTELAAAGAALTYRPHSVRMYSTALPDARSEAATDGHYWVANLRNPVRLAGAVEAALADGFRDFLEISPHPVVAHSIRETVGESDVEDVFVGTTLRRDLPEQRTFLAALGAVHCRGIPVDWTRLQPSGDLVGLPGYAWQGRRLWHAPSLSGRVPGPGHDVDSHNLLGTPTSIAGSELRVWRSVLEDDNRPYPGSHALNGAEIVPAAVLVETFRQAGSPSGEPVELIAVEMRHPLLTDGRREIQVVGDPNRRELRIASRTPGEDFEDDPSWLIHAQAAMVPDAARTPLPTSLGDPAAQRLLGVDPRLVRQRLAAVGVPETGFDWTVEELQYGIDVVRARVTLAPTGAATWAPLLDAVMSIAPAVFAGDPVLRMVVRIDNVTIAGTPPAQALIEVALNKDRVDVVDGLVADADGTVVARVTGMAYPVIDRPVEDDPASGVAAGPGLSLTGLTPERLRELVSAEVTGTIAAEMRLPAASDLHPRRPLLEQGLDSVMTVTIRKKLEKRFGHKLQATVFWQQPTVVAIADHLTEMLTVQA
ncbi:type I polyketide synthase [Nocardia iowensis]|uniref:Acyltransferase domain-containing protein n=1 Tax=Nocardia iowensis TaxID=204891 RepID=A0ABX8RZH0_NOCIO|nr:type I polyketide synthase [Nocardia iowensis]QXN94377.1 acyltransferase domain-containing protein [Nocardia iowensis]